MDVLERSIVSQSLCYVSICLVFLFGISVKEPVKSWIACCVSSLLPALLASLAVLS